MKIGVRPMSSDAAWQAVYEAACAPYRGDGGLRHRWAWHWARGKLAHDPVFRGLLERGELRAGNRVLDIGCGQGLLASLLRACVAVAARGAWPASWPPAPLALEYTGIELMPKDVARANAALGGLPGATPKAHIVCADLRQATLPACDLAVLLDVLHYVEPGAQDDLLSRVRDALAPGGRLLLRVGDAAQRRGFAYSQWIDRVVCAVRGLRMPRTWGRPLDDWVALLVRLGFSPVRCVTMGPGTPFPNVLLVAELQTR